jgi:hypothetical protein
VITHAVVTWTYTSRDVTLLGRGRRLFHHHLLTEHVELELVRSLEGRQATHLRYLVVHRST